MAAAEEKEQETGVTEASLKATLIEKLQATHVVIEDISGGCGQAFSALIVSAHFSKKTTLARHRLVNTVLKREIAAIHAWTARCFTPEEWAAAAAVEGKGDGEAKGAKGEAKGEEEVVVGTTA